MNEAVYKLVFSVEDGKEGGTFSTQGHEVPESGYWVGGKIDSIVFQVGHPSGHLAYVTQRLITDTNADWVGHWVDTESNLIYVDAVDWIPERGRAEALGRSRGEIAIWDIRHGQELRLDSEASLFRSLRTLSQEDVDRIESERDKVRGPYVAHGGSAHHGSDESRH